MTIIGLVAQSQSWRRQSATCQTRATPCSLFLLPWSNSLFSAQRLRVPTFILEWMQSLQESLKLWGLPNWIKKTETFSKLKLKNKKIRHTIRRFSCWARMCHCKGVQIYQEMWLTQCCSLGAKTLKWWTEKSWFSMADNLSLQTVSTTTASL